MMVGRIFSTKRTLWQRIRAGWTEFLKTHNEDGIPIIESDKIKKDCALIIMPKKQWKKL